MEYQTHIEHHFRWNYGMIAGVEGVWGFGVALVSHVAILPVFLERLGASAFLIGLLPATFRLFLTAPQLIAARLTHHLPLKKRVFTCVHYPGCLALLLLGFLVLWVRDSQPKLLIGGTFVWLALFGASISFAMPMWVNLMAKLFPARLRGRAFAMVFLLGGLTGAAGSLLAGKILDAISYPLNFMTLFFAAGVLLSACVTAFLWLREPVLPNSRLTPSNGFLRDTLRAAAKSESFCWFLAGRFVGTLSLMAAAFYTVSALERFSLPGSVAGQFGAALLAGQSVGSLLAGHIGDRFGFKTVAALVPLCDAGAAVLALSAPAAAWYYPVFFLLGLRVSLAMVGTHNLNIEFCPGHDKTTFVALSSTVMCPAYVLGPSLGGFLATHHPAGYNAVFVVALACSIPSFLLISLLVKEPRDRQDPEGIAQVAASCDTPASP